jgi:hypothetical protein
MNYFVKKIIMSIKQSMNQATNKLFYSIRNMNIKGIRAAINEGADTNYINNEGDTPLVTVFWLGDTNIKKMLEIAEILLKHGADPSYNDDNGGSVLFDAGLLHNTEIMELLLSNGGNPNILIDGVETLYDYYEFNYVYHAFSLHLPIKPTEDNKKDVESWLNFLDRCAKISKTYPPDFLRVMRKYGAKPLDEI